MRFGKSYFAMGLVYGLSAFMFMACTTKAPETVGNVHWNGQMHRLSMAMSNLIPLASENRKFYDEKNSGYISAQLKEVAEASAALADDTKSQDNPLYRHTAKSFAQDMSQASVNFDRGNQQLSQFIVSNMPNHCISCHTSMDRGTKNFPLSWAADLKSLNDNQKTQFFLANRQYSSALETAHKVIRDTTSASKNPEAWRQTIEKTLAMVVRVEGDVDEALRIIKAVTENTKAPRYIQRDASVWLKDALQWQSEKNKKRSDSEKYSLAIRLINESRKSQAPQSHSAFIANLRASSLLQKVILAKSFTNYSEALYYAGINSEQLPGLTPWSINEGYYEACIRNTPHSNIAMKCYDELEASAHRRLPNIEFDTEIQGLQAQRLVDLLILATVSDPNPFDHNTSGPAR